MAIKNIPENRSHFNWVKTLKFFFILMSFIDEIIVANFYPPKQSILEKISFKEQNTL